MSGAHLGSGVIDAIGGSEPQGELEDTFVYRIVCSKRLVSSKAVLPLFISSGRLFTCMPA